MMSSTPRTGIVCVCHQQLPTVARSVSWCCECRRHGVWCGGQRSEQLQQLLADERRGCGWGGAPATRICWRREGSFIYTAYELCLIRLIELFRATTTTTTTKTTKFSCIIAVPHQPNRDVNFITLPCSHWLHKACLHLRKSPYICNRRTGSGSCKCASTQTLWSMIYAFKRPYRKAWMQNACSIKPSKSQ